MKGRDWSDWSQSRAESVWSNLSLCIYTSIDISHSLNFLLYLVPYSMHEYSQGKENSITSRKQKEGNARQDMVRQPAIFHSDDHRDVWQTMTMDLISFRFIWHYFSCPVFPFLITSYPILLCHVFSYTVLSYLILYTHILFCHVFCIMTWHDTTWHSMTWFDMTWHDVASNDMIRSES